MTQKAAIAALNGPQDAVSTMLDEYRERRDSVHGWLTANPAIRCLKPKGAFYLLPDISDLLSPNGIRTSAQFAQALLDEARVAVTPGEAFDAPGHIRISYATAIDQLREGAKSPTGCGRLPRRSTAKAVRQGYSCGMKFLCFVRKKNGSISPCMGWSATS